MALLPPVSCVFTTVTQTRHARPHPPASSFPCQDISYYT
uniref:Uncharacterized protein n=1 Tax=Anguilla anguilla TaxID=7936 RepID=A0A0E9PXW7_ANGAN